MFKEFDESSLITVDVVGCTSGAVSWLMTAVRSFPVNIYRVQKKLIILLFFSDLKK